MEVWEMLKITTDDFVLIGDCIYFFINEFNALYSLNMCTNSIEYVSRIPTEGILEKHLCSAITVYNNEIILTPYKSKKIWIYNLLQNVWTSIGLKHLDNWTKRKECMSLIWYNGQIYIIGSTYPAIIVMNPDTKQIRYIEEPYKLLNLKIWDCKDFAFRSKIFQKDKILYLASCVSNEVCRFDLKTEKTELYKVGREDNKYSGIISDGSNFWLSPRKNTNIVKWDGKKSVKEIQLPSDFLPAKYYFTEPYIENGKLLFTVRQGEHNLYIDLDKEELIKYQGGTRLWKMLPDGSIISHKITGELNYVKNDIEYTVMLELDDKMVKKLFADEIKSGSVELVDENELFSLKDFISMN